VKTYEVKGLKDLEKVVVHFQKVSYDSFTGKNDGCKNKNGTVLKEAVNVSAQNS